MKGRASELDVFKTQVNLTEYASTLGYRIDRKGSSRNSVVMDHENGDKIVVAVAADRHWIYMSVRDARDNGSIIDFVQRRHGGVLGCPLGEVRQILRGFTGSVSSSGWCRPDSTTFVEKLEPLSRDLIVVRVKFEAMKPVDAQNHYLAIVRRVPGELIAHPAIAMTIRADQRGNVCFAHHNEDGLCGYEIKNRGFTGFASGGIKGLWRTTISVEDNRLVVAESAIDAISYAAVRGIEGMRLVSIAGQMNATQLALLRLAMEALPLGGRVIAAMDHDAGGEALAAKVHAVFRELGRADLTFVIDHPPTTGADWNDELRRRASSGPTPSPG